MSSTRSLRWHFFRNLADLIAFTALTFASVMLIENLVPAQGIAGRLIPLFGVPLLALFYIWILLRLQGQRFDELGLVRIGRLGPVAMQGLAIAVLLFAIALITEAMGFERDFSSIRRELEGQPLTLLIMVVYAFVGAGLYEEAAFRGFALNRFARMLGSGRFAWIAGAILQGALFGLAHAYQGTYAIFYTGTLGALFGFVFLWNGRNLWPLVLGHGLYDAARFIYFYMVWTHGA